MQMWHVLFLLTALLAPQAMADSPYEGIGSFLAQLRAGNEPMIFGRSRGSMPDELRTLANSEMAKWATAVNVAGIQPDDVSTGRTSVSPRATSFSLPRGAAAALRCPPERPASGFPIKGRLPSTASRL